MKFLLLYYNTVRHLQIKQIWYRLYYRVFGLKQKERGIKREVSTPLPKQLNFNQFLYPYVGIGTNLEVLSFEFLNQKVQFEYEIAWDYMELGKLWCYNLNYFDFLWFGTDSIEVKLNLIRDFIEKLNSRCIGLDPYCISLRAVNWIKFISQNRIHDPVIDESLYRQLLILNNTREYHLMGNHLLENGFSLLFGAYYFNSKKLFRSANQILKKYLPTQILSDGAHYELSPMYHQIILGRLLDCYALISANPEVFDDSILSLLKGKIVKMLGWINKITFSDGSIPYFNDSAPNIANTTKELAGLANSLSIQPKDIHLGASGYRKFEQNTTSGVLIEAVIDMGSIKADEQPGHTHSDIFSFVISVNGSPLVVDTGISTYELCGDRYFERSTAAHNTVSYDALDPIEVWKGFRVARRPKVTILKDFDHIAAAFHDGYRQLGILHHRTWIFGEDHIIIEDETIGNSNHRFDFNLHFHPSVSIVKRSKGFFETCNATLEVSSQDCILENYEFASGYNQKEAAPKLISSFRKKHRLKIHF